ncbi:MAG: MCE family protein [Proteobacteria bacterium]|nr:MCE family protein [Pseudomonadota bacterium]
METKANHVLIGAFTLALIAAILLFILWASKYASQGSFKLYDIEFNENESVTGLSVGGDVQYNGIHVGNVRDMRLDPHDPRRVIARVQVKADTPIKTDTKVQLALQSFATGVAFVQFSGGSPNEPLLTLDNFAGIKRDADEARACSPDLLQQGKSEQIPRLCATETPLTKLLNSSESIATKLTNVLNHVDQLLSVKNVDNVGKIVANVESVTATLAAQKDEIAATLKSARQSVDHLNRTLASAETTMGTVNTQVTSKLPGIVDHLNQTMIHLDSLTKNADDYMRANRGALDSFTNQGLAQLGPTLAQMRQVLRQVDRLTEKVQQNPAGFLLGRDKPVEFKPK